MTNKAVGKATNDVKGIVFAKDASIQDKSNQLGAYVVVSVHFKNPRVRIADRPSPIGPCQADRR